MEKDWAFIARREYWYDVKVRSLADAAAVGLGACMARMVMTKRFVVWPFAPVFGFFYLFRLRETFILHNKKFFD